MLDLLQKRHSQAHLRMLFHNTSPLGGQAQPRIFSQRFLSEAQAQGHLRSRMGDGVSESRASSLAKEFESTASAWLAQAQPCSSSIIRANPGNRWFFPKDFAKMECRETRVQGRELLPLLTLTFTHPCPARTTQRTGGLVTPEARSA
jgi:hypothetical protein